MKKTHILFYLAPLFVLLMLAKSLLAASPKDAALHRIGIRTVDAIAYGNPVYVASIADPEGIYIGYDGVLHTADSFRTDLARHAGVYCELFEKDCKTVHNPTYTLEHVFRSGANRTKSDLKFKINGNTATVEYWEFGGAGDLIATFTFRFAKGRWYLRDIHFI